MGSVCYFHWRIPRGNSGRRSTFLSSRTTGITRPPPRQTRRLFCGPWSSVARHRRWTRTAKTPPAGNARYAPSTRRPRTNCLANLRMRVYPNDPSEAFCDIQLSDDSYLEVECYSISEDGDDAYGTAPLVAGTSRVGLRELSQFRGWGWILRRSRLRWHGGAVGRWRRDHGVFELVTGPAKNNNLACCHRCLCQRRRQQQSTVL